MGKAARNKGRQERAQAAPNDPEVNLANGMCLHCGKRPPITGALWCNPCVSSAKAPAARKRRA